MTLLIKLTQTKRFLDNIYADKSWTSMDRAVSDLRVIIIWLVYYDGICTVYKHVVSLVLYMEILLKSHRNAELDMVCPGLV